MSAKFVVRRDVHAYRVMILILAPGLVTEGLRTRWRDYEREHGAGLASASFHARALGRPASAGGLA